MSLFQCENCGCMDNTALSSPCTKWMPDIFDWAGIEHLKGTALCCVCAPKKYSDGTATKLGEWHGRFRRIFLPKGEFRTNRVGNLEHIKSGSENVEKYEIEPA